MNINTRCLIVDDEPLAINVIEGYVNQIPQLELIATCKDAMTAFHLLNKQKIDLIFLDIEMPELNGIDFVKSLASSPKIILTTAYRDYAIESYEVDVVDYLLKPISFNRFLKAVSKYQKLVSKPESDPVLGHTKSYNRGSIYVYADKKNVKVFFDEILYIESIKDYVRIHTTAQNIISKDTISRYEALLPVGFIRVHRSYIINTSKISAYTHHDIEIGAKEIPIGASYKRQVLDTLKG